jgi:hypothetical protein
VDQKSLHGHRHDEHSGAGAGEQITEQKTSHVPVPQDIPVRPIGLVGHDRVPSPGSGSPSERNDTQVRLYCDVSSSHCVPFGRQGYDGTRRGLVTDERTRLFS